MPMRVQCEQCGSSYTLPDSRLTPGRRVQFQCRHCQHRIVVAVPEQAHSGELHPAEAVSPPQGARVPAGAQVMWFVVLEEGQQRLSSDGVRAAIDGGTIGPETLMWRKGFGEWKRAGEIEEWSAAVQGAHSGAPRSATPAYSQPPEIAAPPMLAPALIAPANGHVSAVQVAGAASIFRGHPHPSDPSQIAVAMPVIRPTSEPTGHGQESRKGLQRLEPRGAPTSLRRETARPKDDAKARTLDASPARGNESSDRGPGDGGKGRWHPATDTWTGPKGNVTRRVPEEQRQALLRQVAEDDAEQRVADATETGAAARADARLWRMVAAAALAAALVAAAVALFAIVKWREVDAELAACHRVASAPAAAATSH